MWTVIFLFLVMLGLLLYLDSRKPKNYPPGPKWWPVLGCALELFKRQRRTGTLVKASASLAEEYGPVVGLKVGKDYLIIVYGQKAIREFLSSEDLAGRPQGPFFDIRTWGQRMGVMLTDAEFWQEQRRFILRHLREFGFGRKNMSVMIEEETGVMIDNFNKMIKDNNGSAIVDMECMFNIHVLNTLWTMLAGIRYSPDDKDLKTLQGILAELFTQIEMVGTLFSQFPILRFIAPEYSGYNMYVKVHVKIWEFLSAELEKHKETFKPNDPRDFMDVYLQMLNSPENMGNFTEKQLLAICLDMFMAGSETTSKTMGFAFLYLLLYPDVQKKAQEEIDQVIGRDRLPSLDDRANMPYMQCVVLESLRMFAGRAFTVPHRAMRDTTLNGYSIPKDAMVIANFSNILFGKEFGFDDPEIFRPERYMKDGKVAPLPDNFIPFGFGKHRCLGESLARANIFLFTTSLLQNFNFAVPQGHEPTTDYIGGITPSPKPYKALIKLRK